MGSDPVATAAAATKSSGSSTFIILIIVFIGLIYFMAIRPGRNRQKKVAQQQNNVRPGARVRTTAGMYATVVAVDGDDVVLEVAPDIEVRYMKRSIMEVLAPGDETAEDEAEPEGAEAEYEDDASAEHEDDLHARVRCRGRARRGHVRRRRARDRAGPERARLHPRRRPDHQRSA